MSADVLMPSPDLNLSFQPFSGVHQALAYCRVPSVQRLESWLTGQVAPWLIVQGPAGSGKSAFVSDWARRHKNCSVRIVGTEGASVQNIQKCLRIHCPSKETNWLLNRDMAHIRYLIIDDAHRLPKETTSWLQSQTWPSTMQVILCTETKPTWDMLCDSATYEMQPWSLDDIGFYCMKRLRQAGWQADLPELRRSVLNKLLQETEGWVSRLDEAICEHWSWHQAPPAKTASSRLQIRSLQYQLPKHFLLTPRGIGLVCLAAWLAIGSIDLFATHQSSLLLFLVQSSDRAVDYLIHLV